MIRKPTSTGDVNHIMVKSSANQQKKSRLILTSIVFLMALVLSWPAFSQVSTLGSWQTGTSHTKVSGTDRALVFFAHAEHSSGTVTLNSVTYGGQPMTKNIDQVVGTGYTANVTAFILDEAGIDDASNSTFIPDWGTTPGAVVYTSVFLANVDQTSIIGDSDSASTTSSNPIVTDPLSTEEGDMVFVAATCGNLSSYTLNNDFTEGFDQQFGDATTGGTGAAGYKSATGVAETPSATYNASINRQVIIGFVVHAEPPDPNLPVLDTPSNGQEDVSVITALQWTAPTAYTPTSYEVFLGTNPVVSENPSDIVGTEEFQPAVPLANETTYYWAVIAYGGTTPYTSATWSFTTMSTLFPEFTGDNKINFDDLAVMVMEWLSCSSVTADVTGDGCVNLNDYCVLSNNWLYESLATEWTGTWSCSIYSDSQLNTNFSNVTLRQVVRVSIPGDQVRLKFSNLYGSSPLVMQKVHLAQSTGGHSIDTGTDLTVTFSSSESVTIPAGGTATSDALTYNLPALTNMAITIYFGSTPSTISGHVGSRTTSYWQSGDYVAAASLTSPSSDTHWYVIDRIDVFREEDARAVVAYGDSITDGYGTTTDAQNRWTDHLATRLQGVPETSDVGVLNAGIGATTVTGSGLNRLQRDVLDQTDVSYLIVLYGVNDIGGSTSVSDIINAYQTIIASARSNNILVYGGTIMPFGGHSYYTTANEAERQEINDWIRTTSAAAGGFDAVIDFDVALRDPSDHTRMISSYTVDGLHPNPAGYEVMGETIDLSLFSLDETPPAVPTGLTATAQSYR